MIIYAITKQRLLYGSALFLSGLLLGVMFAMLFAASQIDNLYIERDTLMTELGESTARINRLEQSLTEERTNIVSNISIHLDTRDQHLNLKLTTVAKQLIADLVGEEVSSIDPTLLIAVYQNRYVAMDDVHYRFIVDYLIISETIHVHLSVASEPAPITGE